MSTPRQSKRAALAAAGLLNAHPSVVVAPLFREHPEFFDPEDLVQVRYEVLRARLVDGAEVTRLCELYGVTRQTSYNLLAKFDAAGLAGLLPGKRGPRGAWKLGPEIRAYVVAELQGEAPLSGATLATQIEERFAISVHKRTVERLLVDLRSKKKRR
jgi:transposase